VKRFDRHSLASDLLFVSIVLMIVGCVSSRPATHTRAHEDLGTDIAMGFADVFEACKAACREVSANHELAWAAGDRVILMSNDRQYVVAVFEGDIHTRVLPAFGTDTSTDAKFIREEFWAALWQQLFFVALRKADTSVMEGWIDSGADIDAAVYADGFTPLMVASAVGRVSFVELLIERGATVDARADNGATALMVALEERHTGVVRFLLEQRADVNAQTGDGTTPLMRALGEGLPEVGALLIENGADIHRQNNNGQDALMFSAQYGQTEIVRLLIERGAVIDQRDKQGATALAMAALGGQIEAAKLLIDHGADVNVRLNNGYTAVQIALEYGHQEMARFLKSEGVQ